MAGTATVTAGMAAMGITATIAFAKAIWDGEDLEKAVDIATQALEIAQNQVKSDGKMIINPSDDIYLAFGYLPVQYTEPPTVEEGYYAVPKWVQTETAIVQEWEIKKDDRPFSAEQITDMFIKDNINALSVDDQTALRMITYYPKWSDLASKSFTAEKVGYKFVHSGKLYKTRQEKHTFSSAWIPGEGTESIYERIDEVHDGSKYDPIPYDGNIAIENGKYYIQDNVIYICTRDSVNPVYHALKDLVGIYVDVTE